MSTAGESTYDAAVHPIAATNLLGEIVPVPAEPADKSSIAPAAQPGAEIASPSPVEPLATGPPDDGLPAKLSKEVDDAPTIPPSLASVPDTAVPSPHKGNGIGTSTLADIPLVDDAGQPLSKSQRKKMLKRRHFEETRAEWKAYKREKEKAAKVRKREARVAAAAAAVLGEGGGSEGEEVEGARKRKADEMDDEEVGEGGDMKGEGQDAKRRRGPQRRVLHPVTIVLDCGFDELMTEKEVVSMSAQLVRCYSANRKSIHQASLAVTSLNARLGKRIRSAYGDQIGSWKNITISPEPYQVPPESVPEAKEGPAAEESVVKKEPPEAQPVEAAPENESAVEKEEPTPEKSQSAEATPTKATPAPESTLTDAFTTTNAATTSPAALVARREDLVYLTADSPTTITSLDAGKAYIVGGIVDRNRHKNLCYKKAVAQGIPTAKLPIGEYLDMASRHVLTTNQVVEIMVKWLETRDWREAFVSVIPPRKLPVVKGAEPTTPADQVPEAGEKAEGAAAEAEEDTQERVDVEMTDAAGETAPTVVEETPAEALPENALVGEANAELEVA